MNPTTVVDLSLYPKEVNQWRSFKIKINACNETGVYKKVEDLTFSIGAKFDKENECFKLALSEHNNFVHKIHQDHFLMDSICLNPLKMDEFKVEFFLHDSNLVKTASLDKNLLKEIDKKQIRYDKEENTFFFTIDNYGTLKEIILNKFPNCELKTFSDGVYSIFKRYNRQISFKEIKSLEEGLSSSIYKSLKEFQKNGVRLAIEKNARLM